jgi:hypothetical protein
MVIPARLLAWAERLDASGNRPQDRDAVARELREAAGEDRGEATAKSVVPALSPAEAPCEPALARVESASPSIGGESGYPPLPGEPAPAGPAPAPALTFEAARDAEAARLRTRSPAPAEPALAPDGHGTHIARNRPPPPSPSCGACVWCENVGMAHWAYVSPMTKQTAITKAGLLGLRETHGWRYEARPIPRGTK